MLFEETGFVTVQDGDEQEAGKEYDESGDPHAVGTDDCNECSGVNAGAGLGIPGDWFEFIIEKCFPDNHQAKNDAQRHSNTDHNKRDHLRKMGCDNSDTPVNRSDTFRSSNTAAVSKKSVRTRHGIMMQNVRMTMKAGSGVDPVSVKVMMIRTNTTRMATMRPDGEEARGNSTGIFL